MELLLILFIFFLIFNIGFRLFCVLIAFLMDTGSQNSMEDTEKFLNKYSPYRKNKGENYEKESIKR